MKRKRTLRRMSGCRAASLFKNSANLPELRSQNGSAPAPGAVFLALAENPHGLKCFKRSCQFRVQDAGREGASSNARWRACSPTTGPCPPKLLPSEGWIGEAGSGPAGVEMAAETRRIGNRRSAVGQRPTAWRSFTRPTTILAGGPSA